MISLNNIKKILSNESGFMGPTHTLSAVAFYLLLLAFFPLFIYNEVLKTDNIIVLIGSIFVVSGFALWPDFDNTRSTVISTLGLLGQGISKLMRGSAIGIYLMTKTKYDDPEPNAHRAFWHTIVAAILVGFIVFFTTSLSLKFTILDKEVTLGYLFAIAYIYISFQLTIVSFLGTYIKNFKKSIVGKITVIVLGLLFSVLLLLATPGNSDYSWIAYCGTLGYLFHIIGDTMTVAGTPILFPLKRKGKRWWVYRIAKIKAGGTIEKVVVIPLFIVLIILALIKIFIS